MFVKSWDGEQIMKCYYLMWAEFQFGKMKGSEEDDSDGCAVVSVHLISLICTLKIIKMVICKLNAFYHNKNFLK